ncbi:YajQ family cyclic di-GMP-binding protein [Elusimicrobiota bacterium]
MAEEFSFDVVSKVDLQGVEDAVNTANREISTRFDFRGSASKLDFNKKDGIVTLASDDEGKLKSVTDIYINRLIKRSVPLKNMDYQKIEPAEGGTVRQQVKIVQGVATEIAKKIVQEIKGMKLKVQPAIQSEQIRVTARSKNDLQTVIVNLKAKDYGIDLQFVNYR